MIKAYRKRIGYDVYKIEDNEKKLHKKCKAKQKKLISSKAEYPAGFTRQYATLFKRSFFDYIKVYLTPLNFFQIIAISAIAGLLWFRRPFEERYIKDIVGGVFFSSVFAAGFFSAFVSLFNFPKERNIIIRERADGMYRLSTYFTAKMTAEIPFVVLFPFLFGLIFYLLAGYRATVVGIFGYFGTLMVGGLASAGFGTAVSSGVSDPPKAPVIATVLLIFFMIVGGFYVDLTKLPVWVSWLSYTSIFKYSYNGCLDSQFIGLQIPQDPNVTSAFDNYVDYIPGEVILHSLFSNFGGAGYNILMLLGIALLFRALAFTILYFTLK
jgi:ABC-type multidrug transport system permease subunit